jgi:hypothetical protein
MFLSQLRQTGGICAAESKGAAPKSGPVQFTLAWQQSESRRPQQLIPATKPNTATSADKDPARVSLTQDYLTTRVAVALWSNVP